MRSVIFIDGAHLSNAARMLDTRIDYKRWLEYFRQRGPVLRHYYFTAVREDATGTQSLRPLLDFLAYNGFSVMEKPAKEYQDEGRPKVKTNIAVELSVTAIELANAKAMEEAVLVVGDADYRALIEHLKALGVRTIVISSNKTDPPMVSDELRRAPDQFMEIKELLPAISMNDPK